MRPDAYRPAWPGPVLPVRAERRLGPPAEAQTLPPPFGWLPRAHLFAGLVGIGLLNGIFERCRAAVLDNGLLAAVGNTFDISVLVWVAAAACIILLLRDVRPASRGDLLVAALAAPVFLIPNSDCSWLALTGVALHLLHSSPRSGICARAGAILLALTVPMFWARLSLSLFSDVVLGADAILVSRLAGTSASSNVVAFADGSGSLWIAPDCSSLTNVSLALLCAVLFVKASGRGWTPRSLAFSALACLVVVAINVSRISAIAIHPDRYELLHGPTGATVAAWLSAAAVLGLCYLGIADNGRAKA